MKTGARTLTTLGSSVNIYLYLWIAITLPYHIEPLLQLHLKSCILIDVQ